MALIMYILPRTSLFHTWKLVPSPLQPLGTTDLISFSEGVFGTKLNFSTCFVPTTQHGDFRVLTLFSFFFFFFCCFAAKPAANGGCQTRGQIKVTAARLHHSHPRSHHMCDLHPSSQQCKILNPLSKAQDWTRNLIFLRQICFHWLHSHCHSFQLLTPN